MTAAVIDPEVTNFQPMPDLSPEEFDALKDDIAAHGVLVPVVKDQHGRIIDGNHRAAIAAELGIDCPVRVVNVSDDGEALDLAVSLNCARRHLSREQVRAIIADEIVRRPDDSDRAIARRVGCSPTTVGTVRAERRQWAEELTERIREQLDDARGRMAMIAHLIHRDGYDWQTVGDLYERVVWSELSKLDAFADLDISDADVFGPLYGNLFDAIRAYDCPDTCSVCTPFDRQYRDEHPNQVYRWGTALKVSNLDTQPADAEDDEL